MARVDAGGVLERGAALSASKGWVRTACVAAVSFLIVAAAGSAWADGRKAEPALAQAQPQPQPSATFDIPPQPLSRALTAFGRQSGYQVSVDHGDLADLSTQGVSGSMSPEEALRRLLAGTGIGWRLTGERSVVLEKMGREGAVTLSPITVEAQGESAWGPVDGYVAKRSATGTKTDTPLIEVPQSISVVGGTQIERQQSQSVGEALRYTPGILKSQGFNRTDDAFYMRGFQINHDALYVNGLRTQPNIYSATTDPYTLERIEVLRGPASVLYGQSSPGGVINMVTKRPTLTPLHEIEAQGGNFDRKQIATDHGGAVDESGQFSYRLTALARESDTMVDFIEDDKIVVAPSLTWRPGKDTSFTLLTGYARSETKYYYGFPAAGTVEPNPNGQVPTERFIGEPDFNRWERTVYSAGYEFEHAFSGGLKLIQNLRFSDFENDYRDIAFGTFQAGQRVINRSAYARVDESSMLSLDTRLQAKLATGPLDHTLVAGVDYARAAFSRVQHAGTVAPLDLFSPTYGSPVVLGAAPVVDSEQVMHQVGLYAQDQVKILDNWRLLLGGRHDWVDDETDNNITRQTTASSPTAFTARMGLVYLTDFGLAPYASYAESFQPQTGIDAGGSPFEPTTGQQYEAGVKYQPKGVNASVTLSVYQLTRQKVLTTDPNNPGFSVQTGEIRARGGEIEAQINPIAGLTVLAGYAYTDAEVTKSNTNTVGNRPENTPKHMASLWAEYEIQETDLRGLIFGGGVRHVGRSTNLTDTVEVPNYTVFDAMVGYQRDGWRLALNATNLFDNEYIAACTYGCFYGATRTVIGTVAYRW